ncbi:hypothetical protein chiPu_0023999 [Chiloscyllium punctatum]|uniref:Uncharacterized protein n=1 Tax=Chiloscyllium punctatum TaxID=137246 RepID=A0A401TCT5_CHIPU|nr:hypothetical protein [Chiloscyllium punctatum]
MEKRVGLVDRPMQEEWNGDMFGGRGWENTLVMGSQALAWRTELGFGVRLLPGNRVEGGDTSVAREQNGVFQTKFSLRTV